MWQSLKINYLVVCGVKFTREMFPSLAVWKEFVRVIIPDGRKVIILADDYEVENLYGWKFGPNTNGFVF